LESDDQGALFLGQRPRLDVGGRLARHGSWNRTKKFGGDILVVYLNKDGTVKSSEVFLTGFLQNNKEGANRSGQIGAKMSAASHQLRFKGALATKNKVRK
jgi:hypothetical protein